MDNLFVMGAGDFVIVVGLIYAVGQGLFWRMRYENLKDDKE